MYSLKGSWSGQTFALATSNDSGGKKSRIRRSKEERKSMVESFIKRYQSSNNGNFPSLNLTHKEVGGSFYTVREIVREIIQENRVLGPGQFSAEEQIDDSIAENYPLGTISSEPQDFLIHNPSEFNVFSNQEENKAVILDINGKYRKHFDEDVVMYSTEDSELQTDEKSEYVDGLACKSTSENPVTSDHQEQASLNASLNGNGQCLNVNETDKVHFLNHMQTNGISEMSDKLIAEGSPECDSVEPDRELKQTDEFQAQLALPTEEVEVETFPLRPANKETNRLSSITTDSIKFDGASDDFGYKEVKLSSSTPIVTEVSFFKTSSDLVTSKGVDGSEVSKSGASSDIISHHTETNNVVQHVETNREDDLVDLPHASSIKGDTASLHDHLIQILPDSETSSRTAEQNNIQLHPKNAAKAITFLGNSNSTSHMNIKEPTIVNGKDSSNDEKAMAGSSPPLDRIDLESWKASKQETNPLLAFFKAFVVSFIKFWSE